MGKAIPASREAAGVSQGTSVWFPLSPGSSLRIESLHVSVTCTR